jgi:hypothetical protein
VYKCIYLDAYADKTNHVTEMNMKIIESLSDVNREWSMEYYPGMF